MKVLNITKENFETEVLNSERPVLVDFWASWCGPCKMLGPVIDAIAEETEQVKVCKINIDEEPELAQTYKIMTIPTVLQIVQGEVKEKSIGVKSKQELKNIFKLD